MKPLAHCPQTTTLDYSLTQDTVRIGTSDQLGGPDSQQLESILKQFLPWRKGPFQFFNQHIDTEWRSDWKWNRIRPHITDLKDRQVLDVGCGNGYHLFRMLGEGAAMACGIDPTRLFLYQFHLARHFLPELPALHFTFAQRALTGVQSIRYCVFSGCALPSTLPC